MTTSDPLLDALGARVRSLREFHEMTQADLAKTVDLTRTSITNLEAGRQGNIPATKLVAIAKALDASVGMLLGEVPMREIPLVQAITRIDVTCGDCGSVRSGMTDADEADKVRREHLRGHIR